MACSGEYPNHAPRTWGRPGCAPWQFSSLQATNAAPTLGCPDWPPTPQRPPGQQKPVRPELAQQKAAHRHLEPCRAVAFVPLTQPTAQARPEQKCNTVSLFNSANIAELPLA